MGLFRALLKTSQHPAPDILNTPIADCAIGVARAKIKKYTPNQNPAQ
jgi:hypothetical protein